MSFKTIGAKLYAQLVVSKIKKWADHPIVAQEKVFKELMETSKETAFGQEHGFKSIRRYDDFIDRVPIRDYEALKPYINRVVSGEQDILWPGRPLYFAKTSGTTSGAKYIPISKASMPTHIEGARNAILNYIHQTGQTDFVDGKMIFLQGSPELSDTNGIPTGRLSGISAHFVPGYLQKNRLPSWRTNCIPDWEDKLEAIIRETKHENMTIISGIPSWVQMYFEHLQEETGKTISELFPNFELFIYGGVNFAPYRKRFQKLIGKKIPSIELFPASEGFFAFQDRQDKEGLLLRLDAGIFYEFVEVHRFEGETSPTLTLQEVKLGVDYVMVISTTAGLWRYNLGDTVRFVSLSPYRIVVSGRLKHFISAFGEHVIGKEVETALQQTLNMVSARVNEFTVAPQVNPQHGLPYHEWFIEFDEEPGDLRAFIDQLDAELCLQNAYYKDLIEGKILRKLVVTKVAKDGFQKYMQSIGKLGGQNKLPRLSNDRGIAEKLKKYCRDGENQK